MGLGLGGVASRFEVNCFVKRRSMTGGFGVLVDGTSGLLDVGVVFPLPITIMAIDI